MTASGGIVAVAGCPHPPLLLPGITGRPVAEVEHLRAACLSAVGELLAAGPSRMVVVGGASPDFPGPTSQAEDGHAEAGQAEDGVADVGQAEDGHAEAGQAEAGQGEDGKALSIVIGRQLLREAGCRLPVEHLVLAADTPPADCLRAGRTLAESSGAEPTALLVMGDGSARRSLKAPGYLDPRAAAFDAGVENCLASGRLSGLSELDPVLAAELLVAGRAAWQALAGAVGDREGSGRLHYSDDPFGVWYPVFSWLPAS